MALAMGQDSKDLVMALAMATGQDNKAMALDRRDLAMALALDRRDLAMALALALVMGQDNKDLALDRRDLAMGQDNKDLALDKRDLALGQAMAQDSRALALDQDQVQYLKLLDTYGTVWHFALIGTVLPHLTRILFHIPSFSILVHPYKKLYALCIHTCNW